jgi:hypothetical protein
VPRKRFKPTEELRQQVRKLAASGLREDLICLVTRIPSVEVLRKQFRDEFSGGVLEGRANVMQTALRMAVADRYVAMVIFLLKVRGLWLTKTGRPFAPDGQTNRPDQFLVLPSTLPSAHPRRRHSSMP